MSEIIASTLLLLILLNLINLFQYGNRPEYYMHAQDEMDLQSLKEGNDSKVKRPPKIKHFVTNGDTIKDKESTIAKSASKFQS